MTYCLDSGQSVTLGNRIGGGGEGEILEVNGSPHMVAKLYHRAPSAELLAKLRVMLASPPAEPVVGHVSLCWPRRLVLDADRQMRGFVMHRADGKKVLQLWSYGPERNESFPGFTWRYVVQTAMNTASAIQAVHERGHLVGDLNPGNVLVRNNALVSLVDCDSMQIHDSRSQTTYSCKVGMPDYLAPELIRSGNLHGVRSLPHDLYAVGVLLFQLLMEGWRPTSGMHASGDLETEELIVRGIYPFFSTVGSRPPRRAPLLGMLPKDIQVLFRRCFIDGHTNPDVRPTAAEWQRGLKGISGRVCGKNPNHWYSTHLTDCCWCQIGQWTGEEHFPYVRSVSSRSVSASSGAAGAMSGATAGSTSLPRPPGAGHGLRPPSSFSGAVPGAQASGMPAKSTSSPRQPGAVRVSRLPSSSSGAVPGAQAVSGVPARSTSSPRPPGAVHVSRPPSSSSGAVPGAEFKAGHSSRSKRTSRSRFTQEHLKISVLAIFVLFFGLLCLALRR
ncbi:MAG TPA: protein kinase [Anaeromyxobacteraceae bacterium]|nr:protein kinase [Anaeromyxobacteraceae bacterium]